MRSMNDDSLDCTKTGESDLTSIFLCKGHQQPSNAWGYQISIGLDGLKNSDMGSQMAGQWLPMIAGSAFWKFYKRPNGLILRVVTDFNLSTGIIDHVTGTLTAPALASRTYIPSPLFEALIVPSWLILHQPLCRQISPPLHLSAQRLSYLVTRVSARRVLLQGLRSPKSTTSTNFYLLGSCTIHLIIHTKQPLGSIFWARLCTSRIEQ